MAFQRVGQFIEFKGESGIRFLARISAIQLVSDVDEMAAETYVTVAGRTILVRQPFEELRDALQATALGAA